MKSHYIQPNFQFESKGPEKKKKTVNIQKKKNIWKKMKIRKFWAINFKINNFDVGIQISNQMPIENV